MNKPTIRTITSATAVAAAMLFGAGAMAQTPPGSTKAKDEATMPAPSSKTVARTDPSVNVATTGVATTGVTATTDATVATDATVDAKAQRKQTRQAMRADRAAKQNANNDSVGNLGVPATKGDGKN